MQKLKYNIFKISEDDKTTWVKTPSGKKLFKFKIITPGQMGKYQFIPLNRFGEQKGNVSIISTLRPEEHYIWEFYPEILKNNKGSALRSFSSNLKEQDLEDKEDEYESDIEKKELEEAKKKGIRPQVAVTKKFKSKFISLDASIKIKAINEIIRYFKYRKVKEIFTNYRNLLAQSKRPTEDSTKNLADRTNIFGDNSKDLLDLLESKDFFKKLDPEGKKRILKQAKSFIRDILTEIIEIGKDAVLDEKFSEEDYDNNKADVLIFIENFLKDTSLLEEVFTAVKDLPKYAEDEEFFKFFNWENVFKPFSEKKLDFNRNNDLLNETRDSIFAYGSSVPLVEEEKTKEESLEDAKRSLVSEINSKYENILVESLKDNNKFKLLLDLKNRNDGSNESKNAEATYPIFIELLSNFIEKSIPFILKNTVDIVQVRFHSKELEEEVVKSKKEILEILLKESKIYKEAYSQTVPVWDGKKEVDGNLVNFTEFLLSLLNENKFEEIFKKIVTSTPEPIVNEIYELTLNFPNYSEDEKKKDRGSVPSELRHNFNYSNLTTEDIFQQGLLVKFLTRLDEILTPLSQILKIEDKTERQKKKKENEKKILETVTVDTAKEYLEFLKRETKIDVSYKESTISSMVLYCQEYIKNSMDAISAEKIKLENVLKYNRFEYKKLLEESEVAKALANPNSLLNVLGSTLTNNIANLPSDEAIEESRGIISRMFSGDMTEIQKMDLYQKWTEKQLEKDSKSLIQKLEYELKQAKLFWQRTNKKLFQEGGSGFFGALGRAITGSGGSGIMKGKLKMSEKMYHDMIEKIMTRYYIEFQKNFEFYNKALDKKREELGLVKTASSGSFLKMLNVENKIFEKINTSPSKSFVIDIKGIVLPPKEEINKRACFYEKLTIISFKD